MNLILSYIIVTYNSASYIQNCLNSIFQQDTTSSEIIVIDNASKDFTVEILKTKYPEVSLIENHENLGYAAAVNKASSIANGEWLLILNPDTILPENFYSNIQSFFKNYPHISIVGMKLVNIQNKVQFSAWRRISILTLILEMMLPYFISKKIITVKAHKLRIVHNISGACMLIKKDVFKELNGFDEEFFLYYEDSDLCYRASKLGYKIYYNPEIEVIHNFASSSWKDLNSFFLNFYKSKLIYYKKHFRKFYYRIAYLLIIMGIVLRIVIYSISGFFLKHLHQLSRSHIFALRNIVNKKI